ncbi:MAG: NUDIX hydrolase [Ardenticatenaceae bacterium]|nr:NUDIX hydrolase [Anaerolineales bacterium]MCB8923227.1 NUDIX hydrolase [Ardenticatenaceae bacterium]MCB9004828.1 NUDIX hydrolase [Ardenticatenaceae bacterium]
MNDGNSRIVWHGRPWQMRAVTERLPNGQTMERAFIDHPGAVVLVPVQQTAVGFNVLMLRQYRAALGETILELPAGTRGWDEKWLTCAQRELREETGFRAASLIYLGEIWPSPGVSNEQMRLYMAAGLEPDPLPADADEEISVQPMPLPELLEMARNGRIHDAKSIIGLWWAAEYFSNQ